MTPHIFQCWCSALVPESNKNPVNQEHPLVAVHKTATLLAKNPLEVSENAYCDLSDLTLFLSNQQQLAEKSCISHCKCLLHGNANSKATICNLSWGLTWDSKSRLSPLLKSDADLQDAKGGNRFLQKNGKIYMHTNKNYMHVYFVMHDAKNE